MRLDAWIIKTGPKIVAKKMKVDPSTVSSWRTRKAFPRPDKLRQIYKLSEGKVTYEEMVHHFCGR